MKTEILLARSTWERYGSPAGIPYRGGARTNPGKEPLELPELGEEGPILGCVCAGWNPRGSSDRRFPPGDFSFS